MASAGWTESLSELRYTTFPDLHPCRGNRPCCDASRVPLESFAIPNDVLLIAWAILLTKYTQVDEPIFRSDEISLQFQSSSKVLKRIPHNAVGGDHFTGVYFGIEQSHTLHDHDLCLFYNSKAQVGELRSDGSIPPDHLEELGRQLRLVIQQTTNFENRPVSIANYEHPALSILNPIPKHVKGPQLLHELVKWYSPKQNVAIDFVDGNGNRKSLTWDQLDKASNKLARDIQSRVATRQQEARSTPIVPVLIPQSPELYVTQLAILKAGCAFCPLNLDAPEQRIKFILRDVSAVLVVTIEPFRDKLFGLEDVGILEANLDYEALVERQHDKTELDIDPAGPAYVMYTSGSTGTPKGVSVSHRSVTQALLAHDRHIPPFRRFLQFASPTFDVSVFEVFFPLFRGCTLVGCDRSVMLNDLNFAINSMAVDAAELTPTVTESLLQKRENVPGLKLLLTIGEMLTRSVIEEFGHSSDRRGILYGMYGPTEAAIHCTLQSNFRVDNKVGIIGVPLATVSVLIVAPAPIHPTEGSHVEVLPVGQVGELAVGGVQLANGYLNRPDQTTASFVETQGYGQLYRTGDKARLLPDGSIECLGRIGTGQVKLRGQRVELGEIEQVVLRDSGCRAAVASVINGIVVVFCLLQENRTDTESIFQLCRKWLPAFMVPGDVVLLREFPRLPSGKVDKKRLEQQHQTSYFEASSGAAAQNKSEAAILYSARTILGEELSVVDNLAQSGLDSLRAIRFASLLRHKGLSIEVTSILKHRSIRELAQKVHTQHEGHARMGTAIRSEALSNRLGMSALENEYVTRYRSDLSHVLPCTPLQNALLIETSRNKTAYWNWIELGLRSGYSEQQIRDAFRCLTDKNEILRSGFCETDDPIYPFALLVWQSLMSSQVQRVDGFSHNHLKSGDALQRPLNVQILFTSTSTRILLQIHHALYDGWSMDLMIFDIDRLLRGEPIPARPQFIDLINYHVSKAQSSDEESDRFYWQEKLSAVYPCELPNFTGKNHPHVPLARLDLVSSVQPEKVRSCARKHNFSPQVYFQAAFAYLLAMYSGSSDVVFGTVSSGRTLPITGIEEIIGPCIATLPLCVNTSQSRSCLDLLRTIHRLNRELLEHCSLPLRDVKNRCGLQPGKPLFDTLLIWQETLLSPSSSEVVRIVDSADYLEFNLLLEFYPSQDSLHTRAAFQPSLIPSSQMQMLLAQVDSLVSWMLRYENEALQNASLSFEREHLSIENLSPSQTSFDGGVAALVQKQARDAANEPAIAFATKTSNSGHSIEVLTYAELDEKATRLAHFLKARGLGRNMLVCICMEKSVKLYTCILAAIYVGAGHLPLTPDTPPARIKLILEEAEVFLCLSRGASVQKMRELKQSEIVDVDSLDDQLSRQSTENLDSFSEKSDPAYAMFTSGSTGTPKGVLVTQQNLSSNIKTLMNMYPVSKNSRLLQACSQAFDVSVFEIFFTWSAGMCLCAATNDVLFQDIEGMIRQFGITHLSLTPTVAALIKPDNVPTVRFLVTAGEAVTEHVFRAWTGRGLWQGYGPSETTNICTVNSRVSEFDMINNIGSPFPNTSAFLILEGSHFKLVPRGGVGELCFGGDQVFKGYLGMPELNFQKIIDHSDFGRIYRSGDLGRFLPDGSILFEGRTDDQVKLRGQRIELGEINMTILNVDCVRDCFSMVLQRSPGFPQSLITFWVPDWESESKFAILPAQEGTRNKIDSIYEAVRAVLPAYMVPASLVPISCLPMTIQGKIDKRRLAFAYNDLGLETLDQYAESSSLAQFGQDWNVEQTALASVVAEVLDIAVGEIGLHTSFFSLGLDSITAISVARLARRKIGLDLDISTVLKCPTVSRLYRAAVSSKRDVEKNQRQTPDTKLQDFSKKILKQVQSTLKSKDNSMIEKILPCTPLQEAMLSLSRDKPAYHNRMLFRIEGDIQRLRDSWQEMVQRHGILRTQFMPTDDPEYTYAQVLLSEAKLPWKTAQAVTADFNMLLRQDPDHLFTDKRGSNLPYSLTHMSVGDTSYLVLTMHHALYDAAAMDQLLHEVEMFYLGEENLTPAIPFDSFLGEVMSLEKAEADRFWARHLNNFVPIGFPRLSSRSGTAAVSGSTYHHESKRLDIRYDELEQACKCISTTILNITQAAFAKILSLFLGRSDVCFGNVVSGRSLPIENIEHLVAPCFNTLPVRIDVDAASTNTELIQYLQQHNIDVLPFQLTPLRRIQLTADYPNKRLFDALFILQQPSAGLDHRIWSLEKNYGVMNFPLVIELIPDVRENMLLMTLHFESLIISSDDVQYVFNAFEEALRSCMKFPSAEACDLVSVRGTKDASAAAGFIIISNDRSLVPIFGVGELYLEGQNDRGHPGDSTSIERNGRTFYKTGKSARLLPNNEYSEIKAQEISVSSGKEAEQVYEDIDSSWTELELSIRETMAQIARTSLARVKKSTTIYRLGLDSINAVQVASKLRAKGINASASDVMEHPTCLMLASFIQRKVPMQSTLPKFDLDAFDAHFKPVICVEYRLEETKVDRVRPCTPLQSGLLAESIRSQAGLYVNEIKMQLHTDINLQRLIHAWNTVQQKYAMLRTGFVQINDNSFPMAMVEYSSLAVELPWYTCSRVDQIRKEIDQNTADTLTALHRLPWRLLLFTSRDNRTLVLLAHHALYDAHLLQRIFDDVAKTYIGSELALAAPLDDAITDILENSADETEQSRRFWEDMSRKMPITRFPNLAPLIVMDSQSYVELKQYQNSLTDLEERCHVAGTTMQAVSQAAWAQVLSSYVGETSVTFGVVYSGRTTEATEHAPLPCITTIPIPCSLGSDGRRLLDDMLDYNARVQRHQFTPLPKIQRWTGHPDEFLFDTILTYQKRNSSSYGIAQPWNIEEERATVNYAVSIELEPSTKDDTLTIHVASSDDVLPRPQAKLMLEQFEDSFLRLLSVSDDGSDWILSRSGHLLSIMPANDSQIPSDIKLLHQCVERTATRVPGKAALRFATSLDQADVNQWSYLEIDEAGNRVAHLLQNYRARPGELIATCFDKSPEASFAFIGILKAGCAFVALDLTAPLARKDYIIEDSHARIVLATEGSAKQLPQKDGIRIIKLDTCGLENWSADPVKLEREVQPDDLSYCLYTSGTTGAPKGCMITHENVVQAMLSFQRLFAGHWNQKSRWLQFASFHFDVSVLEQFWSWSVGICVVSAPRDLIFQDISEAIRRLRITHIDLTPSLAKLLHPDDVPSLCEGVFITGGEPLKQEIIDVWGPKHVIYNGYGPTEATIGVTMFPRVRSNGKPSNIGKQFDNVGTYVLRPNSDTPVFRGGMGELCIAGKLVGKGYLNRPELTDERFPFLERYRQRVYRTGDLVRITHDGNFMFLGRIDDQVKLRGQRLEVAEINNVIRQALPELSDIATLVLQHPKQLRDQLITFMVSKRSARQREEPQLLMEAQLSFIQSAREACEAKLSSYMIPSTLIPISAIPLTVNNKLDAHKLQDMFNKVSLPDLQNLSETGSDTTSPLNPTEKRVAMTLARFLSIPTEEVSRTTNIFELGLDSVSAISFARALKDAAFENCDVAIVMKNPQIQTLVKVLTDATAADRSGALIAAKQSIAAFQHKHLATAKQAHDIDQTDIESLAPCTPLQEGIISRSLESENPVYFNSFSFELYEHVDVGKLKSAWQKIFEAVQILRTRFVSTVDGYMQVVVGQLPFPWTEMTLSNEEQVEQYLRKSEGDWIDKNQGLLAEPFEIVLASSPTKVVLALHIFHALYDGNSIQLLLDSVASSYASSGKAEIGPDFHNALPFGPLRNIDGAQHFWIEHLGSVKSSQFYSLIDIPSKSDCLVSTDIDGLTSFDVVRQRLAVTDQALFQACWAYQLFNHLGSNLVLGNVISGRSIDFEGADRIIGPLFNTIPFAPQLHEDDTWESIVRRCHDFNVSALPYQHTPLRDILKWCKRTKNSPLFDVLFVFQKETPRTEAGNRIFGRELQSKFLADYPLALEVQRKQSGGFTLTLAAQGHIADAEKCTQMLQTFEETLSALLAAPDHRICTLRKEKRDSGSLRPNNNITETTPKLNRVKDFMWTPHTSILRSEISRLAGVDESQVDEHSSILELGLDSIDTMRLSSSLKRRGVKLSANSILRNLTISKMMRQASIKEANERVTKNENIPETREAKLTRCVFQDWQVPKTVEQILPVTPLQEAMLSEMLSSEFERYFNHDILKISENISMANLQSAWERTFAGTPILRTKFVPIDSPDVDDTFVQVIHKHSFFPWDEINHDMEEDISKFITRITEDVRNTFTEQPPVRLTAIYCPKRTYLILSLPHSMYDGWSLPLLHETVHRFYSECGDNVGRVNEDAGMGGQSYTDALHQIATSLTKEGETFWRSQLTGYTPSSLPARNATPSSTPQDIHRKEIHSRIAVEEISSFCRSEGVTLQAFGASCWSIVLATLYHRLDVVFGIVVSGRDHPSTESVIFPTMNTVCFRSIIHGTKKDMLRYTQDNTSDMMPYQHFPLRKIQRMMPSRGERLFDTLFIYQKRLSTNLQSGSALYESVGGVSYVEYPICIEMQIVDDALIWRTACYDNVFDAMGTENLLRQLDTVAIDIISNTATPTLSFSEAGTSVCGLQPFPLEAHGDVLTNRTIRAPSSSDSTWPNIEQKVRRILSAVSKVPEAEITKDMTIFHLGLDSISTIKVSALLRKEDVHLSVNDILGAGSIKQISALGSSRNSGATQAITADDTIDMALKEVDTKKLMELMKIDAENIERILPTSAGQDYMLSMWQNSEGASFFPQLTWQVWNCTDLQCVEKAWSDLVRRIPILRTCFVATAYHWQPFVQVVVRKVGSQFFSTESSPFTDNGSLNVTQPLVYLSACIAKEEINIRLHIHHALYDAISLPVLRQNLEDTMNGIIPDFEQVQASVESLASTVSQEALSKRRDFWTRYLADVSPLLLVQPSTPHARRVELFRPSMVSTRAIESLARAKGISLQAIFLAVWARIYASFQHQSGLAPTDATSDVVFGVYLANRSHLPDPTAAHFPTVNLVPLRVRAQWSDPIDVARRIQDDLNHISRAENAAVRLWEIDRWTEGKVKLDCFVNFLSLQGGETENWREAEETSNSDGRITVKEVDDEAFQERKEVIGPQDTDLKEPAELKQNLVRESYLHSIDIEAAVRNGSLDVGIFAPENMVGGIDGAERVLKELVELLEKVGEGGEL